MIKPLRVRLGGRCRLGRRYRRSDIGNDVFRPRPRQWNIDGAFHLNAAWHQHDELAELLDAPGNVRNVDAMTEIDVGARGAADGGAGVLRHHQVLERVFWYIAIERELGVDPDRRAVDVIAGIDRDGASGRERDPLRAKTFVVRRKRKIGEKDE